MIKYIYDKAHSNGGEQLVLGDGGSAYLFPGGGGSGCGPAISDVIWMLVVTTDS